MRVSLRLAALLLVLPVTAVACTQPTASRAPTSTRTAGPTATSAAATSIEPRSPTAPPATPSGSPTPPGEVPATAAQSPGASPATASPATSPATASPATSPVAFDPSRLDIGFEQFVSELAPLTLVTHAGDGSGRLYAVEQRGMIRVIESDGSIRDEPFLDMRARVSTGFEQGLLGLAFHPDYETNGRAFVDYTDTRGDTVVAELRSDGERADGESERIILTVAQPFANHNGGMVAFGPDGYLYISLGDGGGGGDPLGAGQDLGNVLGKILRIDVDAQPPYSIPPDNPFAADEAARPEIWARGLRNPWRFSFDRLTGDLFIGDVGQGAWEEVDAEPAGEGGRNYGWSIMEGPACFRRADCDDSGLVGPVAAYERRDGRCAVTGGYVYRGERFPLLAGAYLYSDYCSGEVWALDAATAVAGGSAEAAIMGESGINPGGFGEDEAGELYLAGQDGQILRITATER